MKTSIFKWDQNELVRLNLDTIDALILTWFDDFKETGKMKPLIIKDRIYFWIHYDSLLKEIPILDIKKDTLYRRFKKYCDIGLMYQYLKRIRQKTTLVYFSFDQDKRYCLLSNSQKNELKSKS